MRSEDRSRARDPSGTRDADPGLPAAGLHRLSYAMLLAGLLLGVYVGLRWLGLSPGSGWVSWSHRSPPGNLFEHTLHRSGAATCTS